MVILFLQKFRNICMMIKVNGCDKFVSLFIKGNNNDFLLVFRDNIALPDGDLL